MNKQSKNPIPPLLAKVILLTQDELYNYLYDYLSSTGYDVVKQDGFIFAAGTVPVMLVAHLDTVHKQQVTEIYWYDESGKPLVWSPQGIGGDDRAGVYIVLEILRKCRCSVLFCRDEEIGGIGASKFIDSGIVPDINYIVEFDRKGNNEAVFYDCCSEKFTQFVTSHGYDKKGGVFSDISIIAPALGIAAVNLSCGYYNAHTLDEYIVLPEVSRAVEQAIPMIKAKTDVFGFEYGACMFGDVYDADYYDRLFAMYDYKYGTSLLDEFYCKNLREPTECELTELECRLMESDEYTESEEQEFDFQ